MQFTNINIFWEIKPIFEWIICMGKGAGAGRGSRKSRYSMHRKNIWCCKATLMWWS